MGRLIARADRDDLLACLLWTGECRIAEAICKAWADHAGVLRRESDEAKQRREGRRLTFFLQYDQVSTGCRAAAAELYQQIEAELAETIQTLTEAETLSSEIRRELGVDFSARAQAERAHGYTLDTLAVLRNQLRQAESRLADLLATDRTRLHGLAITESFRRRAERTTTLPQIDQMSAQAFTELVHELLSSDGHLVVTPTGRCQLLAIGADGRRMSVALQHRKNARTWGEPPETVNTTALHKAHRAAVAAAAEAVVVTNATITQPALRFAAAHQLRLIDREELQRWAEWGEPVTQAGAA
ncbi:Restriction endonuclease (plasmid) [Streptomyces sp. ADI95-16]|nr:Restriction endonuclease [Streptomyces sp. ADI95-16]